MAAQMEAFCWNTARLVPTDSIAAMSQVSVVTVVPSECVEFINDACVICSAGTWPTCLLMRVCGSLDAPSLLEGNLGTLTRGSLGGNLYQRGQEGPGSHACHILYGWLKQIRRMPKIPGCHIEKKNCMYPPNLPHTLFSKIQPAYQSHG